MATDHLRHCEPVRTLVWQSVIHYSTVEKDCFGMSYYVYILANKTNTTVYTGVTNNLPRRVYEHKHNMDAKSFTAQYSVHKLVYYEVATNAYAAISREKQIKGWNRRRKNELVEMMNPEWKDLYDRIME